jgi:hypothetical protein
MSDEARRRPSGVDVNRTLRIAAVNVVVGRKVRVGRTAGTGGIADVQAGAVGIVSRPNRTFSASISFQLRSSAYRTTPPRNDG